MSKVRVFAFAPDWGLPTVGPFALKLLVWLELAGIPYEQVIEANPRSIPGQVGLRGFDLGWGAG